MNVPATRHDPAPPSATGAIPVTHHRTVTVDGVGIFYREAGPADAPVVLLLHGFPTSSHMFRNLIPALADRYRVIAPDYPGYGQSDAPDRAKFAYTFDRFAGHFALKDKADEIVPLIRDFLARKVTR